MAVSLSKFFPFWVDVKGYKASNLAPDFMAGITVAVVASPQSMAYAIIAGVDPIYGLYASMLPVIVAALWGSSRYLLAGPTNAIAMILYSTMAQLTVAGVAVSTMPESVRLAYIFAIALLAGLLQLLMGLARLGDLANFISHTVIVAFTTGAALLIALGQVKNFLGLNFIAPPGNFELVQATLGHISQVNWPSLCVGLGTLAVAVSLRIFLPRLPYALLALVGSSFAVWFLGLEEYGVAVSGAVPLGLPPLTLPGSAQWDNINALFMPALAIAMLGAVESIAIARTMAGQRGDTLDSSQELVGQGLGNMAAGLFSGIPGCGSFSRSAVNYSAGARTRFAAVFSGLLTLVALLSLGGLVRYIPIPALAALLLLICWNMVNKGDILFSLRATKEDALVWWVTVLCTLVLDLEKAVFVGVILSLFLFLRRQSHPKVASLTRAMVADSHDHWMFECPYLAMYYLEGPLFFGAVNDLEEKLGSWAVSSQKVLILQMNRVNMMDATGAHALREFLRRCAQRGIKVIVTSSNDAVRNTMTNTGLNRGMRGCYLTSTLQAATLLATTLLRECGICGACCGCQHGTESLASSHSDICLLPECNLDSRDTSLSSDALQYPETR